MEENEWEPIQPSDVASTTTTQSDDDDGVVVVEADFDKPSIFPPSDHEGLPVSASSPPPEDHFHEPTPATFSPPSSYSSSSASSSSGVVESELGREREPGGTGVKAPLGNLSSGVWRIAYGIRSRIGFRSIVSAAAFVVMAVYWRRWQRWRRRVEKESKDQLMVLMNQKDEKIKQLLIQIDRMNEILSARRRVPVHRIVADRPFVSKQRSNWKPT